MTEPLDAIRSGGDDLDFMREAMHLLLQALIDLETTQVIRTARYESSNARPTHRNGSGPACCLSTKAGHVELAIPNCPPAASFPPSSEPPTHRPGAAGPRQGDLVHAMSTRKVDDLLFALDTDAGVSKTPGESHLRRIRRRRGGVSPASTAGALLLSPCQT